MTVSAAPALVGISHGTSSPLGRAAVAALMRAVATANPEITVSLGFVDVQHPDPIETLAALPEGQPAVVVPLLLSAGYHVHVDLTEAVRSVSERPIVLSPALGPDALLVEILQRRLAEAGLADDDTVILAVAGSSDARAVADCRRVAELLSTASAREVAIGFLAAAEPRLADAVTKARLRSPGSRIIVSSYLLAPGYFQSCAEAAGADVVTSTLLNAGPPPTQLVEVVSSRYRAAV